MNYPQEILDGLNALNEGGLSALYEHSHPDKPLKFIRRASLVGIFGNRAVYWTATEKHGCHVILTLNENGVFQRADVKQLD